MNDKHPLTESICQEIGASIDLPFPYNAVVTNNMRRAYDLGVKAGRDEQMEQVMQWLDKNIANYHYRHYYDTGNYPRPNRRWDRLTAHLKEEMRPINTQETS